MTWYRRLPIIRRFTHEDVVAPSDWDGPAFGPRVLVEEDDSSLRSAMVGALQDAGFQTAECRGPGGANGERTCPLTVGGECAAVDQAAAVLQVFVPSDVALNEVRGAIHRHSPDTPIAVLSPPQAARRHTDLLVHATVCTAPLSRDGVVTAVEATVLDADRA